MTTRRRREGDDDDDDDDDDAVEVRDARRMRGGEDRGPTAPLWHHTDTTLASHLQIVEVARVRQIVESRDRHVVAHLNGVQCDVIQCDGMGC